MQHRPQPQAARICEDWAHACQPPHVQLQAVLTSCRASAWQPALHSCTRSSARLLSACAKHKCCLQGPILAFVYAVKEMLEEGRGTSTDLPVNVAFVFEVGMPASRLSCHASEAYLRQCLEEKQLLALHVVQLLKLGTAELSLQLSNALCTEQHLG